MSNLRKRRISQLSEAATIDSTSILPISTGTPLVTKKISANNLLANCAKLSGVNIFTGAQQFEDGVSFGSSVQAIDIESQSFDAFSIGVSGSAVLPSNTTIGSVTHLEIGRLSGVTSGIQSQLNAKANLSGNNTLSGDLTVSGTSYTNGIAAFGNTVQLDATKSIIVSPGGSILPTKLLHLSGVTSEIQGQFTTINNRLNNTPTLSGDNTYSGTQSFDAMSATSMDIQTINSVVTGVSNTLSLGLGVFINNGIDQIPASKLSHIMNLSSDAQTQLNSKTSPSTNTDFTVPVTAPTPSVGDNSTKVATTAFVNLAMSIANSIQIIVCTGALNTDFIPATDQFAAGRLAYNTNSQELFISNGSEWVSTPKLENRIYLFLSANTGGYRGNYYIWNGIDWTEV